MVRLLTSRVQTGLSDKLCFVGSSYTVRSNLRRVIRLQLNSLMYRTSISPGRRRVEGVRRRVHRPTRGGRPANSPPPAQGRDSSHLPRCKYPECACRAPDLIPCPQIRFSNDKTPYKTGFSASFSRSGRKGIFAACECRASPVSLDRPIEHCSQ